MQEAAASCPGVRDVDPDPDPPDSRPYLPPDHSLPLPRRPSFALELFDRFERVNSDEFMDDVIMTDNTPGSQSIVSSALEHSSSPPSIPRDDPSEK